HRSGSEWGGRSSQSRHSSYWMNGEPNDQNGKEDCVEIMNLSGTVLNWNDLPSTKSQHACPGFFRPFQY
uniref:C-type lectin domain-containing protein n=1 Tax=Paramormyrops kingsleyae TaxID=1676925 RepID=A0A3B3SMY5_9TELE